jgi:phage shock protein A
MRFFELLLVRSVLLVGLPLLLVLLAVGPKRFWKSVKRGWTWLWQKRLDPEEILTQVVDQYETLVASMRDVLAQSEIAEKDLLENIATSEKNVAALKAEAKELAAAEDETGARAALYKLNLEQQAMLGFRNQLDQLRGQISESRKRLFLVELQLRQYEVGRSILLTQLAEAKGVEQQYAIASNFDPFNAVADWQRAEGMVHEKALVARAKERVHADTSEPAGGNAAPDIDPAALEAKLAELRAAVNQVRDQSDISKEPARKSMKEIER